MFARSHSPLARLAAVALAVCAGDARAGPAERRSPVVAAAEKVKSAVVAISTEELVQRRVRSNDPLERYFQEFFAVGPTERGFVTNSLGSGVVIDARGYVVTNYHVIERGSRVKVSFTDGKELLAKVVGTDPRSDLAVLKVEASGALPAVALASGDPMIGETAIAIGNPFGLSHTVTTGVVSALHRQLKTESASFYDFIQTDASINPGNSGGPLLNIDAELIGINTAIYGEGKGIGFAIPADRVRQITDSLIRFGEVKEAWLGLAVEDAVAEDRPRVLVTDVEPDGPAARAGVKTGDVIAAVQDSPLRDADEFHYRLHGLPLGKPLALTVARAGGSAALQVVAEEFPLKRADALVSRRVGLELRETSLRTQRGSVKVLAVRAVRRGSAADRVGLEASDWVRAVNSVEVYSLDEFRREVRRALQSGRLTLLIQRGHALEQVEFAI